jgi:hypothetical protein
LFHGINVIDICIDLKSTIKWKLEGKNNDGCISVQGKCEASVKAYQA